MYISVRLGEPKCATYGMIRSWVKETYGETVTNLDISRCKKEVGEVGLAQTDYNGRQASGKYQTPERRANKEAMVMEAFRFYGMIEG